MKVWTLDEPDESYVLGTGMNPLKGMHCQA